MHWVQPQLSINELKGPISRRTLSFYLSLVLLLIFIWIFTKYEFRSQGIFHRSVFNRKRHNYWTEVNVYQSSLCRETKASRKESTHFVAFLLTIAPTNVALLLLLLFHPSLISSADLSKMLRQICGLQDVFRCYPHFPDSKNDSSGHGLPLELGRLAAVQERLPLADYLLVRLPGYRGYCDAHLWTNRKRFGNDGALLHGHFQHHFSKPRALERKGKKEKIWILTVIGESMTFKTQALLSLLPALYRSRVEPRKARRQESVQPLNYDDQTKEDEGMQMSYCTLVQPLQAYAVPDDTGWVNIFLFFLFSPSNVKTVR